MASTGECEECKRARTNKYHGGYWMQCLHCCARLVLSTHPSKPHAAAMLSAIERFPDAPTRQAILARLKTLIEARHEPARVLPGA